MEIPEIKGFKEDVLMMVIDDDDYGKRVPIQLGTLHIDQIISQATPDEITSLNKAWDRARICSYIGGRAVKVQECKDFTLDQVKGSLKLTKDVTLQPFESVRVRGITKVRNHQKRVHVIVEPREVQCKTVSAISTYSHLKPGSSKISIALRNFSCRKITVKAKSTVATISAANIVPGKIAPKESGGDILEGDREGKLPPKLTQEQVNNLLTKLEFKGPESVGWTETDQQEALKFLTDYGVVFAKDDMDLGKTSLVRHQINLTDYRPFKERYRRIPPHQYEEVRKHLQEMLDIGAIRKSQSPWASAVVLVRKKDGSLRFCIDLRKLNARTVRDAYSLPRIDETLDCLKGALLFSSIDLKAGYWQVEMDEDSKALTAFTVGPLGFYECERMPFGLTNAPATFQRLMENCLGDLNLNWCIIYLDDVIIFSKTPKEHIQRLRGVFQKLWEAGLKLKPSKCEFFRTRISYLGHIVSKDGIETDPKKVTAIKNWPIPTSVTDVRSFLGFTNHYRRFIKGYAQIAKPLYKLISGKNSKLKKKTVDWRLDCDLAFKELKDLCSNTPVLAYADYTNKFMLHTDASELGLGAILYQEQDKEKRVIAYASRTLSSSEKNYPAHKLEFLALKWAVTDQFHEYLYGGKFEVYTDNNPLTYILTTAKLDATGQRWVARLADYDFNLHYRSGKCNVDADALSRIPWTGKYDGFIEESAMKAIVNISTMANHSNTAVEFNSALQYEINLGAGKITPDKMTNKEWVEEQTSDSVIGEVRKHLLEGTLHQRKCKTEDSEALKKLLKHRNQLVLRNNLVYRKISNNSRNSTMQFVLPSKFRECTL